MEKGFEGRSSAREKGPVRDQVEEEILAAERAEQEADAELELASDDEALRRDFERGMVPKTEKSRGKFGSGFSIFSPDDGRSVELREQDGEEDPDLRQDKAA